MKAAALITLIALSLSPFAMAETFWNKDKSKSFEGTYVRMEGDKFVFERKKDRKTFRLSAAQLAPESIALIEKLQKSPPKIDSPSDPEAEAPKGGIFDYRNGGLFFSVLPKDLNLEAMWKSLEDCKLLTKNDKFLEFPGETEVQPQGNSKAYNFTWLDREWVLVAQHPNIAYSMVLPEFLYFLPASADYTEEETVQFQKELAAALTKVTGLEMARIDLYNYHPSIRGNEPGGKTPSFFKNEVPGKAVSVGFYRYSYQPKRMICLYTTPYGRVEIK